MESLDFSRRDFLKGALALGAIVLSPVKIGESLIVASANQSSSTNAVHEVKHQNLERAVILCFDGSRSIERWDSTLSFADTLSDLIQREAHFTYFINTAYLFERCKGSDVGNGGSKKGIRERIIRMQKAINKNHEIACHTVHHKNGSNWTFKQWYDEISEFDSDTQQFLVDKSGKPYKSVGFRAPYLAYNAQLYKALNALGYKYDSSVVGNTAGLYDNIVTIGLPYYIRDNGKKIVGMDYNWYVNNVPDKEFERMLGHYIASSIPSPIFISMHFPELKHGKESYFEIVKRSLMKGAVNPGYRFMSMGEYVVSVRDIIVARALSKNKHSS